MPEIKVIYWNIENFGGPQGGRRDYVALGNFIAQVLVNTDADVLCIMEMTQVAVGVPLFQLQSAVLNAFFVGGVQTCDWCLDYVPGSLIYNAMGPAYSPNNVGFTGQGRNEGYLVLWKQNIAKFIMQEADRIDVVAANRPGAVAPAAGTVLNTQSNGVRVRAIPMLGGINYLPISINVPAGPPPVGGLPAPGHFILPLGTIIPAPGILAPGGALYFPAVGPPGLAFAPVTLNPGHVLPAGTQIGPAGLQLNSPILGTNQILIPGNYILPQNFTLPAAGTRLISTNVLSLVLTGRQLDPAGNAIDYNPAGGNAWQLLSFPATGGANIWNGSRRPAFCTIKTNTGGGGANDLVPIVIYHAPLASPRNAITKLSLSQVAYEAFDFAVPGYARNPRALLGGDLNLRLDVNDNAYTSFSDNIAGPAGLNGGVGCVDGAGNPLFRVLQPALVGAPAFPPTALPLTEADNPENKSTIQLNHPVIAGNSVLSNNLDHFRRLAIDNIFYRGFTALQSPRQTFFATPAAIGAQQTFMADLYDLMAAVSDVVPPGAGAPMIAGVDNFFIPPAIVQQFLATPAILAYLAAVLAAGLGGPAVPIPFPNLNSVRFPSTLTLDLIAGVFQPALGGDPAAGAGPFAGPGGIATITPERRAAEFIKLFISDHLPVIFTMDI